MSDADGKRTREEVLRLWVERDLSAEAEAGELPRAHAADDMADQICELLSAGGNPVLTGEPGVGKTSVIYELVNRVAEGRGPDVLAGGRIVQISFRNVASTLTKPDEIRGEMKRFVEMLTSSEPSIIPFIRDIHLAYRFDLEPQLHLLALRLDVPVLGEGQRGAMESMFEYEQDLRQHYLLLEVEEPSLSATRQILQSWCDQLRRSEQRHCSPEAAEQALYLTHRFLARMRLPRKALDLLEQTRKLNPNSDLTPRHVVDRFCRSHHVPRQLIDPSQPLLLAEVEDFFLSRVFGQDEAVEALVHMVSLIKAGLSDIRRPFGVFMFVGPTGVGKTHVAQLLTEYLFGAPERLIRLNMADFQEEMHAAVLFGDPNGNNTAMIRGLLTRRVVGHPFAVVLMDEFEKAHQKVHDRFMQLVDEGEFINGASETISCRSTIIIATLNTGAEIYRTQAMGFNHAGDVRNLDRELDRRLRERFRFEFLNRFDRIVHFHPLSRENIRTIALRELRQLQDRIGFKQNRLELEVDDSVLDWLAVHGYEPEYGARFLRRTIERHVSTALANAIVGGVPETSRRIALAVRRNQVSAALVQARSAQRQQVTLPLGTTEQVRSLDRRRLEQLCDELLAAAEPRLLRNEARKEERSTLLGLMNDEGFWDDAERSQDNLQRYRELDVAIRVEDRLAGPLLHLGELRSDDAPVSLESLARALERASGALKEWEERLAEEGAKAVWLVLSKADVLASADDFVENLVALELAWCRRLRLEATVAAYALADGSPSRVVIEVEGPGAEVCLAMEQGLHRLRRPARPDCKARIEVIPRFERGGAAREAIQAIRRRQGRFSLGLSCRGRVEVRSRGLCFELLAADAELLSELLPDLQRAMENPAGELEVARIYGVTGGVRDPRTDVVVRAKEAWKGRLDRFHDAWRHARGPRG